MRRGRISPATAISLAALFFSLTGAGIAASRYLITNTSQIKPSVRAALLGRIGAQGPQGPQGQTGAPGTVNSGRIIFVTGDTVTFTPTGISEGQDAGTVRTGTSDAIGAGAATCPAGYFLLSGGYRGQHVTITSSFAQDVHGDPPVTWIVDGHADPSDTGKPPALSDGRLGYFVVFAECAPSK